jgi:hypothetical protein
MKFVVTPRQLVCAVLLVLPIGSRSHWALHAASTASSMCSVRFSGLVDALDRVLTGPAVGYI